MSVHHSNGGLAAGIMLGADGLGSASIASLDRIPGGGVVQRTRRARRPTRRARPSLISSTAAAEPDPRDPPYDC
jgi:hypothetical protein